MGSDSLHEESAMARSGFGSDDNSKAVISRRLKVLWVGSLSLALGLHAMSAAAHAQRVAVPPEEKLRATQKLLDDGFEVRKANSPTAKQELVKELMTKVINEPTATDEDLFAALKAVISQSQSLRDLLTMLTAVERLVTKFDVPAGSERTGYLVQFLDAANWKSAITLRPALEEVLQWVRKAISERRYSDAGKIVSDVDAVLVSQKVPASARQPLIDLHKEVIALKEAVAALESARLVLQTEPDDPAANLTVGSLLVTQQSDWKLAVPHLAKATNHKGWQTAAVLELTPKVDAWKAGDA